MADEHLVVRFGALIFFSSTPHLQKEMTAKRTIVIRICIIIVISTKWAMKNVYTARSSISATATNQMLQIVESQTTNHTIHSF